MTRHLRICRPVLKQRSNSAGKAPLYANWRPAPSALTLRTTQEIVCPDDFMVAPLKHFALGKRRRSCMASLRLRVSLQIVLVSICCAEANAIEDERLICVNLEA